MAFSHLFTALVFIQIERFIIYTLDSIYILKFVLDFLLRLFSSRQNCVCVCSDSRRRQKFVFSILSFYYKAHRFRSKCLTIKLIFGETA